MQRRNLSGPSKEKSTIFIIINLQQHQQQQLLLKREFTPLEQQSRKQRLLTIQQCQQRPFTADFNVIIAEEGALHQP